MGKRVILKYWLKKSSFNPEFEACFLIAGHAINLGSF